jgi:hypothetical protein
MQYPKSAELKVPFVIHMQSEADYETLKQRFNVSNLNDLKKVIAAELAKHLLQEAKESKLNYVFERKERVEEINPKEDVKEMLKARSRKPNLPWE